jgi:uncharacterized RDD family membrane protein YckC
MPTVGVGRRGAAVLIDHLLFVIPATPLLAHAVAAARAMFSESLDHPPPAFVQPSLGWESTGLALLSIAWFSYMIAMEATKGASLGKLALRIRVIRLDGQPMDGFTSFVRNILRVVDSAFVYLVGAIIVWSSPLRQRLGDKAAKTVVVPAAFAATYRGVEVPPPPSGIAVPPRPDR